MRKKMTFCLLFWGHLIWAQWSFTEKSNQANLQVRHVDPKMIGGGVVVFDYDNDGFEDLYFTGGVDQDKLFRNNRRGGFDNVTKELGIAEAIKQFKTVGAVSGDLDNDGFRDLIITTDKDQPNLILKNLEATAFELMIPFTDDPHLWSSSVILADCNGDSFLDIYVFNYVGYTDDPYFQWKNTGLRNIFYQNNGGFQFSDITASLTVEDHGAGLAGVFSDFDNDGDPDLFVVNDFGYQFGENTLFVNQYPELQFHEVESNSNLKVEIDGMGIAQGDYNEDGLLDYYLSNWEDNLLFANQHDEFVDQAGNLGIEVADEVSWGTFFFDFNNDSYLDLFVANGSMVDPTTKYTNRLFQQDSEGKFTDISADGIIDKDISRGAAYGDFNNDGYPDMVVVNINNDPADFNSPLLFFNDSEMFSNNWVKFKLHGTVSNRDAIGARLSLHFDHRTLVREIDGGSSYLSQNSSVANFGIGKATDIDSISILWPNGLREVYRYLQVNTYYEATENVGLNVARVGIVTDVPDKNSLGAISISPNPFDHQIEFNLGAGQAVGHLHFVLYDLLGRDTRSIEEVKKHSQGSYLLNINTALPGGLYYLMIADHQYKWQFKLLKP